MTGWDRIVFRVCCTVTAVLLFDQAVFAGQFLGGSFGALRTHRTNATVAGIGILVTAAAGLVVRLRGGPGWPALASLGMFALTALQILLGFRRMLTVHIPLGVAIIALMLGLTIWSWRRQTTADTHRRTHAPFPARPDPDRDSGADDRGASGGSARAGTVSGEGAAVNRRDVLRLLGGTAAAAGVGVPLVSGIRGADSTGALLRSRLPLPRPFQRPLPIPETLPPSARYEIVQRPGTAEILPGVATPIWGYNGTFPGPTFRTRSGHPIVVRHRNELPVPTVVHLHGGHTPAESDGYPTDLVEPAGAAHDMATMDPAATITTGQRDYRYPQRQRAATLWYHDHRMDFTGQAVWRGLAGFHIVTDDEEDRLPLPRGDRDLPLMIADRSFAADGGLAYPPGFTAGLLGDVVTVNGVAWPYREVAGLRYRLRLLNASNARRYRLTLDPPPPDGPAFTQIGTDGGLLETPRRHDALEMAPAQRFDVVVDFARYPPGSTVRMVNTFGAGTTRDVMQFRVGRRGADDTAIPGRLSAAAPAMTVATTRTFRFRHDDVRGMPGWTINGQPFDPLRSIASPRLGAAEIWRITSDFHHPVHVHLAPLRVLSRGTGGPGDYDHGWKDTVDLRPAEEARLLIRFDDYPGRYVLHCHNLEHEDMAMMATFTTV